MEEKKQKFHGSDLEQVEKYFHVKKENILSYSANVNPLGISPLLKDTLIKQVDAIMTYPDRDYDKLRASIGEYNNISKEYISVGNGSTELISLYIHLTKPKKALLIGPTYSEYEREITISGGACDYFMLHHEDDFALHLDQLKETLTNDYDLLILCNPNNPTSTALDHSILEPIISFCHQHNVLMIIDETYVEFTDDIATITAVPLTAKYDNLVILRGISKFFASPGLRLGYAICGNLSLLKKIEDNKNPWSINTLAALGGEVMFQDTAYINQTKELICTERNRIYKELSSWDSIYCYAPTVNFILCKILVPNITGQDLFTACIKEGMMIRDCSSFEGLDDFFFRFCFRNPDENDRLLATLKRLLER